jgi:hypothetical protein
MHRLTAAAFSLLPLSCLADGSAWLPEPETGTVSLSYVFQTSDEFYRADRKVSTPGGGEAIVQHTDWLNLNYALEDDLAFDLQVGYAMSEFMTGPGIPTTDESFSGLADVNLGLTWRIVDELISEYNLPSIALRVGAILAGHYETGYINSLGDGGSGKEASLIVGKVFADKIALSGEFGYRQRNHNIPDDAFINLSASYFFNSKLSASLEYKWNDARSGLDIGGPGFSPAKFPELEEDYQAVGLGLFYTVTDELNLGLVLATVVDGRNTNDTDAIGLTMGYAFETF